MVGELTKPELVIKQFSVPDQVGSFQLVWNWWAG